MFTNKMICQIDEYMLYCQSKQLSEKTMESYEQTLHLLERWCGEEMLIENRECLLDALENDDLLNQVQATVSATMSNYSPKFTLNREERVLYFEVTSDQDSTDAVLFYPGLSYAFFSVLENNMCDISSQIYEVTQ